MRNNDEAPLTAEDMFNFETGLEPSKGSIFSPLRGQYNQRLLWRRKFVEIQDCVFAIAAIYDAVFLLNMGLRGVAFIAL